MEQPARLAAEVLGDAWRCYRRHLVPIVGLSLVGAVERPVLQYYGDVLPGWAVLVLESAVWGSRVLLLVLLFRWSIATDDRLRGVGIGAGVRRVRRYARRYPRPLLAQLAGLVAVVAVLDLLPDLLIAPRVAPAYQALYWSVLLAVKNPTVIAFAVVWELALLKQALVRGAAEPAPTVAG
ncbi:MAG TPA: hypothetical protein VEZ42_05270 [Pseudonocardia sp.]|nr:hypothetical protein [Pseudonocardia sp.]